MRLIRRIKILRKPKVFVPALIALVLIAAAVLAVINLDSPAVGTITNEGLGQPVSAKVSGNKSLSDSVVSFSYPARFIDNHAIKQAGTLDSIALVAQVRHDEYIAIGLYKGDIANDSGAHYRGQHPELYKLISSDNKELVYKKTDGKEYTGFLQRGADVATISFTSISPTDVSADYQLISKSLKIK